MTGQTLDQLLGPVRVVPVAVVKNDADAAPLANALLTGGLPCIEVTFRTSAATAVLRRMAHVDGLLVGAGSVREADQVRAAVDAGARFVVSPGFSPSIVETAEALGVPVLPGVATASDILRCLDAGLSTVKFFPAAVLGGLPAVQALSAPFPGVSFVPTGGITEVDANRYLRHPAVRAVGGSWMLPDRLLSAGDFAGIADLARRAAELTPGVAA